MAFLVVNSATPRDVETEPLVSFQVMGREVAAIFADGSSSFNELEAKLVTVAKVVVEEKLEAALIVANQLVADAIQTAFTNIDGGTF